MLNLSEITIFLHSVSILISTNFFLLILC